MKELNVLNLSGKEVGKVSLDEMVFDGKINTDLIHQAVVAFLANQRLGLACTKTRGEVSGSGRKPWKQKGTGRARIGSIRSPLWYKGGRAFGPKPHSFHKDLPKKMKANALRSALNSKLKDSAIIIIEDLKVAKPKTKEFAAILKNLNIVDKKVKFLVDKFDEKVRLSSRNIPMLTMEQACDLNAYTVMAANKLVFTKESLKIVQDRIKKVLQ
jgi:large subunit ribosomal protein L4